MRIPRFPALTCRTASARTCTGIVNWYLLIVWSFLLLSWPMASVTAQSSWKAAADSSNRYLAEKNYEKAYAYGLRMIAEAEPLHVQNAQDTTLVTSLVRVIVCLLYAPKIDSLRPLPFATRAISLLTPALAETVLEAKVYGLNAIVNYSAGHHKQALLYAETAAGQFEKLKITNSAPYCDIQRCRAKLYAAAKDSASLDRSVAIVRQILPITARLFGVGANQYYQLLRLWADTFQYRGLLFQSDKYKAEVDSVWEAAVKTSGQRAKATDVDATNILYDIANYYSVVGRHEKACEFAARMLAKADTLYTADPKQDTILIQCLHLMARNRVQLSQLHSREAISYLDRALALLQPAYESKPWVAELYGLSGQLRADAGDRPLALEHIRKAVALCVGSGQTENMNYIQAQRNLAAIYISERDKDQLYKAQQILEAISPLAERLGGKNSVLYTTVMGMLGSVYTLSMPLDDFTQRRADQLWQTLIPLTRELGNRVELCRMLNAMGEHHIAQNRTDLARTALRESIDIGKTLSNQIYRLIAMANLSTVETATGQFTEAARSADEIIAAPESRQIPQTLLTVTVNAVDGNRQIGRLDRAEVLARQAMQLAEELFGTKINYFYAGALGQLGVVRYQQGDFSNATYYLDESLGIMEKTARPNDPVLSRFRSVMGDIYISIDKEKALYYYREARRAMELQPNYQQSISYLPVLRSEMAALRQLGQLQAAVQFADSTIRLYDGLSMNDQEVFPLFLEEAYYTYHQAGRRAKADSIRHWLERILANDTLSLTVKTTILNTIGTAHQANGNYPEAIRRLSEGIDTGKILHGNSSHINAYIPVRLAMCHLNLGNRAEAVRIMTEAVGRLRINVAQNLWYMSENQRETYVAPFVLTEIYGMAFQNPTPLATELKLAYDYRLLMQGVLLNTSRKVLQSVANQRDTVLQQRVQRLFGVRKIIAQYSLKPSQHVDLDSLEALATQLEKQIGQFAGTIRQQTKAYTWQNVQRSLKPAEAAIEIIRFNQWDLEKKLRETDTVQYAALIIRPEWSAPRLVLLPNGAAMESDWLRAYRAEIENAQPGGTAYRRFWQPIAEQLTGVQRAFLAADGVYHLVSLPTLYNAARSRFLMDELQLVIVGSTREVAEPAERQAGSGGTLFGFPAYRAQRTQLRSVVAHRPGSPLPTRTRGDLSFDELPASEIEVNEIARLLVKARIRPRVSIGTEASEPRLKAVINPRVLHMATHGFFKPDTLNQFYKLNRLMACGLALAGAADTTNRQQPEDEDGILTGYEASLLNLGKTELVTLSACETGVGDALAGEGVFGLQRAFRLAGAKSVLMSLWKANDDLVQQLMTDFYRYWLAGASKPQALRKAQQNLRRQHPEPYNWGAFVLLGQ